VSGALDSLAELAGIQPHYRDYFGNEIAVSEATKRALLAAMSFTAGESNAIAPLPLPPVAVVRDGAAVRVPCALSAGDDGDAIEWQLELEDGRELRGSARWSAEHRIFTLDVRPPLGYHRLTVRAARAACALIVVPEACYVPPAMEGGRVWALATQLYALRSAGDWGIGDFSSLQAIAAIAARAGCGAIALNPLHALHSGNPAACSPYGPSSRLFLNALYIDVARVPELAESPAARELVDSPEFQAALRSLRAQELVDYPGVALVKRTVLELLFRTFCAEHLERPGDARASSFRRFVRAGGIALERLVRYEALGEHFRALDPQCHGWPQWPPDYRAPENSAVAAFARAHADRIAFFTYLQWLADEQLRAAARAAHARGVALYRDLAVGVDLYGADAWGDQTTIAAGASLGAPPDPLNTLGQNWGLPPLSPHALRARAYAPLVALLRANMRHAGILRVDHVMALQRAFWIPRGRPAIEGAYVRYDLEEMLGILALESVRARCAVVGEDLGTVPDGFRERLQAARVLSSRLLYFERTWDGTFLPPGAYPRLAAVSLGTHDLPPLAGWWIGGGTGDGDDRRQARFALVDALERSGAAAPELARRLREDAAAGGTAAAVAELSEAVHRFLGATPAMLVVVAIEDVLGETGAVNVPGTVDEHPNWRRRRTLPLEALETDGRLLRAGAILCDTQNAMLQRDRL
jgi:4-alpha-glucanotransferase